MAGKAMHDMAHRIGGHDCGVLSGFISVSSLQTKSVVLKTSKKTGGKAFSWTFARYFEDALSFELEGQVAKWFKDQNDLLMETTALRWVGEIIAIALPHRRITQPQSPMATTFFWASSLICLSS
jgi:hypothetical protein